MTLDKQIEEILRDEHPEERTITLTNYECIREKLKRLIKKAELKAYRRGRHHGRTKLVLDLEWGQTTMEEEIKKLEFPMKVVYKSKPKELLK